MLQNQLELKRERNLEAKEFRDSLEQDRTWMIAYTKATLKEEVRYGMQAKEMLNVYVTLLKGSPTDSYHITDSYRPLILTSENIVCHFQKFNVG